MAAGQWCAQVWALRRRAAAAAFVAAAMGMLALACDFGRAADDGLPALISAICCDFAAASNISLLGLMLFGTYSTNGGCGGAMLSLGPGREKRGGIISRIASANCCFVRVCAGCIGPSGGGLFGIR